MNPHDPFGSADFKSAVSADFTIRASRVQYMVQSMLEAYPVPLHLYPPRARTGSLTQRTASSQIAAIPAMFLIRSSGTSCRFCR